MISKKLTSKAGITIPKALRADMGWQPNMAVDLIPQEDGSLTIRPHIDLCRFCGAHESVKNTRMYAFALIVLLK